MRAPLAYQNEEFLKGPDGRPFRILAEYLEPLSHFERARIQNTVVFFGSARVGQEGLLGQYYTDARDVAKRITEWSEARPGDAHRFVVCTGGGPGIMEAANRGASEGGGVTVGLNIGLPFEQLPNPYISPDLNFEFHYFFMRKFWFAYLAKALIVFPGGFGTMDELFEILTLAQTRKLSGKIQIVLYGSQFWKEIINFEALVKYGTIAASDMDLFQFADTTDDAVRVLQQHLEGLTQTSTEETPDIAQSAKPGAEA